MKAPAVLAILLATVAVAQAETATVRLGTIAIDHDPTRWEVISRPPGTVDDGLLFLCRGPDCRTDGPLTPGVSVDLLDSGAISPEAIAQSRETQEVMPFWDALGSERTFGNVRFVAYELHSRCRAYVPSMLRAVGTSGGRNYAFATGFNAGCMGDRGVGRRRFEELLEGVRAVEGGAK